MMPPRGVQKGTKHAREGSGRDLASDDGGPLQAVRGVHQEGQRVPEDLGRIQVLRDRGQQVYSPLRATSIDYTFALLGYRNHDLYFGHLGGERGEPTGRFAELVESEFQRGSRSGSRHGCCRTGAEDRGSHTICAVVTTAFLEHQRRIGNDLVTPMPQYRFPGLEAGDRWCVTAMNWLRAHADGAAAYVVLASTHERARRPRRVFPERQSGHLGCHSSPSTAGQATHKSPISHRLHQCDVELAAA
jgi:uncharacterized protein (DUF2237 family)